MSVYRILDYPDPGLKRVGLPVSDPLSSEIQFIIKNMVETLFHAKNCAALAATQLDIPNAPSITVIALPDQGKGAYWCLINPKVIWKSEEQKNEIEACMSVYPNSIEAKVARSTEIEVEFISENGQKERKKASGFMAKCLQHEIDHLNGQVYLEKLPALKRLLLEQKIRKQTDLVEKREE